MEIWLKKDDSDYLLIPVNPEKIGSKLSRNYDDLVLASGDEKTVMSGKNLQTYTLASFIPKWDTFYVHNAQGYERPMDIVKRIERWMNESTVLLFQVTETIINKPITIRSFDWEENHVGDIDYTLELKEYQPITFGEGVTATPGTAVAEPVVYVTGYKAPAPEPKKAKATTSSRPSSQKTRPKTHTVKSGETLWTMAKKYYGDESAADKIYEANKDLIGPNKNDAAPGMKLVFP